MDFGNIDIKGKLDSFVEGTKETAEIAHQKTSEFHENYITKVTPDFGKYGDAAVFVAEMAPGVSEYNAIREGDWQGFAISAGIDVAAVAIGAFSAGTGYAAVKGTSTVAKAGVKAATKEIAEAGAKKVVKEVTEAGTKKAVKGVAEAGAEKAVKEVVETGTKKAVKEVAENGSKTAAKKITETGAKNAAKELTELGAEKTAKKAVEAGTEKAAKEVAKKATEKTVKEVVETGVEKTAKEATEAGVEKISKEAAETGAEKAAKEVVETATERTAKEVAEAGVEKTAKETAETATEKTAKEVAETGTEKSVKETVEAGSEKNIKESVGEASETATKEVRENIDAKPSTVDSTKRINPDKNLVSTDVEKKLKPNQIKDLNKRGMSPKCIENCTIKNDVVELKTLNEKLADTVHPESGVPYAKKTIDLHGTKIEGVFPKFDAVYTTNLPEDKLLASDKVQFDYCIEQLQKNIEKNPSLKDKFSPRQLEQIMHGKTPGGYTWHHNEEVGKMELVDTVIHDKTAHTGGKAIWGGGR